MCRWKCVIYCVRVCLGFEIILSAMGSLWHKIGIGILPLGFHLCPMGWIMNWAHSTCRDFYVNHNAVTYSSGTQEIRSRQAEDSGEKAAGYAEMKSWNCWFGDACAMQKGNDVTRHLSFCGGLRLTKKVYLFVRHIHELPLMRICSWDILKFACHKQTVSQAKLVLVEGRSLFCIVILFMLRIC